MFMELTPYIYLILYLRSLIILHKVLIEARSAKKIGGASATTILIVANERPEERPDERPAGRMSGVANERMSGRTLPR